MKVNIRDVKRTAPKLNFICCGVVFSGLYWILESVRDVISFQRGTLIERVFFPDAMTCWVRILVVCVLILSSVYAQAIRERVDIQKKEQHRFYRLNSIISIGFGFGILYWLLASCRDTFLMWNTSFIKQFLFPCAMTFWMRMLAVLMIFLFSLYVCTIINEYQKKNIKIEASLKEKETLLHEIHHRVKNNLQIISSLLNLQSRYAPDKEVHKMFEESRDRVRSMALVHETLYGSHSLAEINFEQYISKLVLGLYSSYAIDLERIRFESNITEISMEMDLAIPCGLIINELVTNCFKYAFPKSLKANGKIRISIKQKRKNGYELIVSDNGIGIPQNINLFETKSLGMKLVNVLVKDQLNGSLQLEREKGTKFIIRF